MSTILKSKCLFSSFNCTKESNVSLVNLKSIKDYSSILSCALCDDCLHLFSEKSSYHVTFSSSISDLALSGDHQLLLLLKSGLLFWITFLEPTSNKQVSLLKSKCPAEDVCVIPGLKVPAQPHHFESIFIDDEKSLVTVENAVQILVSDENVTIAVIESSGIKVLLCKLEDILSGKIVPTKSVFIPVMQRVTNLADTYTHGLKSCQAYSGSAQKPKLYGILTEDAPLTSNVSQLSSKVLKVEKNYAAVVFGSDTVLANSVIVLITVNDHIYVVNHFKGSKLQPKRLCSLGEPVLCITAAVVKEDTSCDDSLKMFHENKHQHELCIAGLHGKVLFLSISEDGILNRTINLPGPVVALSTSASHLFHSDGLRLYHTMLTADVFQGKSIPQSLDFYMVRALGNPVSTHKKDCTVHQFWAINHDGVIYSLEVNSGQEDQLESEHFSSARNVSSEESLKTIDQISDRTVKVQKQIAGVNHSISQMAIYSHLLTWSKNRKDDLFKHSRSDKPVVKVNWSVQLSGDFHCEKESIYDLLVHLESGSFTSLDEGEWLITVQLSSASSHSVSVSSSLQKLISCHISSEMIFDSPLRLEVFLTYTTNTKMMQYKDEENSFNVLVYISDINYLAFIQDRKKEISTAACRPNLANDVLLGLAETRLNMPKENMTEETMVWNISCSSLSGKIPGASSKEQLPAKFLQYLLGGSLLTTNGESTSHVADVKTPRNHPMRLMVSLDMDVLRVELVCVGLADWYDLTLGIEIMLKDLVDCPSEAAVLERKLQNVEMCLDDLKSVERSTGEATWKAMKLQTIMKRIKQMSLHSIK